MLRAMPHTPLLLQRYIVRCRAMPADDITRHIIYVIFSLRRFRYLSFSSPAATPITMIFSRLLMPLLYTVVFAMLPSLPAY